MTDAATTLDHGKVILDASCIHTLPADTFTIEYSMNMQGYMQHICTGNKAADMSPLF